LTVGSHGGGSTYAGAIADHMAGAGTVGLVKTGAGTQTLSGQNIFTGGTTVGGGVLRVTSNMALPSTGAVVINGATLDIQATSSAVGKFTLGGNGLLTGSGGTLSTTGATVQAGTVAASLTGTGGLVKSTAGTVILSAPNSYAGGTTVNAGLLLVNNAAGVPTDSVLWIGPSGAMGSGTIGSPSAGNGLGGGIQSMAVPAGLNAVPEPGTMALVAAAFACGLALRLEEEGLGITHTPLTRRGHTTYKHV